MPAVLHGASRPRVAPRIACTLTSHEGKSLPAGRARASHSHPIDLRSIACPPCTISPACSAVVVARDAVTACGGGHRRPRRRQSDSRRSPLASTNQTVRRLLGALADDSMQGRATATRGSARAARFIAEELAHYGVQPAGDSGFFQRVPVACRRRAMARQGLTLLPSLAARDTVPADARATAVNVVGIIPGSDPVLRDQVVLDRRALRSSRDRRRDRQAIRSTTAPMTMPRASLRCSRSRVRSPPVRRRNAPSSLPRRPAKKSDCSALAGTSQHPARPLEAMVANLEIEMIGRPDSLAGGPGRGWLTGFERSTMGELFAGAGLPIVADRRLDQQFFMRSDNIAFAQRGIVAHTLSSYNMHNDYHEPSDDIAHVDFAHMTQLMDVAVTRVLA